MKFDPNVFREALRSLPEADRTLLAEQLCAVDFRGCLRGFETAPLTVARALLAVAVQFSVAPISGFSVGAVAMGAKGDLYLGANLEFLGVTLSASLHAEQSAVLNAWMHGERRIQGLVVSAAPCGHCRQFLCELPQADQLQVYFEEQVTTLGALLPMRFGAARAAGESLLDSASFQLEPVRQTSEILAERAINAAQNSYAPYTLAPEGFVLECINGSTFIGRTAESVAFNPTVPAIVGALNQRNLSNSRHDAVTTCVHAKLVTSLGSQEDFAQALLRRMTRARLQTVLMETV